MVASPFPPQTQIGVHPDEGNECQVNEHEGQGPFGVLVHGCVSLLSALCAVCRNARKQSMSVTTPTRVPLSTTGRQPIVCCKSTRPASTMVRSGPIHTTSLGMHVLIG